MRVAAFVAAMFAAMLAGGAPAAIAITTTLSPDAKQHFSDNNGHPCTGCKLFTYIAGTTTKQTSYTNQGGLTPNLNPVIMDARGEANVWLNPALSYKFTLAPANDTDPPTNSFWTVDNITTSGLPQIATGTVLGNVSGSTAAATALPILNYPIPATYPGNNSNINGHNLLFADISFLGAITYSTFASADCSTAPVFVTVTGDVSGGTATNGDVVGLSLTDGVHTTPVFSYTYPNDGSGTAAKAAKAIGDAFKADTTINTIYGGTGLAANQCTGSPAQLLQPTMAATGLIFNSFYTQAAGSSYFAFNMMTNWAAGAIASNLILSATGGTVVNNGSCAGGLLHACVASSGSAGGPTRLENAPVTVWQRRPFNTDGSVRHALTGDILTVFYFVGPDNAGNDQSYGSLGVTVGNPSSATPYGITVIGPNTSFATAGLASGLGVWDSATYAATSSNDPGVGTLKWRHGIFGYNGSTPAVPLETRSTTSDQFRASYSGTGLNVTQQSAAGSVTIANVANNSLILAANNIPVFVAAAGVTIGPAALSAGVGELGMYIGPSASATGALGGKIAFVCGSGAGTAKLIAYAGTSATPTTVVDNIGGGVSGC